MFDSILKPKKAKGQKGKRTLRTKPVTYSLDDFRRVPYGMVYAVHLISY